MYFVYTWFKPGNIPFYVGMGRTPTRWNPLYSRTRNPHCHRTVQLVGIENVRVAIVENLSKADACRIEQTLIWYYGRSDLGLGPLTNLTDGGEGIQQVTESAKIKMSISAKATTKERSDRISGDKNPMRNKAIYTYAVHRMNSPEVLAKYSGNANPAKRPEVQAKIRAKWADPEYKAAMIEKKKGRAIHSNLEKEKRRQKLLDPNNPMREFHKTLNSDPNIKAKRVATLRTPEVQAKISAALKLSWARRKGLI